MECVDDDTADLPTVLVVDDDAAIREMLALALELEGYRVLQARDGREALSLVARESVHLVTLDVMMPGLSGWDVADALHADPRTRPIPRIMISGIPIDALMKACAARQAAAILTKPFDLDKVIALIGQHIAHHRVSSSGRSPQSQSGGGRR
jgi:CheY-like chemotaxis protein